MVMEQNVALSVNVEYGVLVEIMSLGHRRISKLDEQCICISEVANLHGTNLRSKNALCTVSPFGKGTTRKKRFSISVAVDRPIRFYIQKHYSGLNPIRWSTPRCFSQSVRRSAVNCSGVPWRGSAPCASIFSTMSGI